MEGEVGFYFIFFYYFVFSPSPPWQRVLPAEGAAKQQGGQGHGARSKKDRFSG